MVSRVRPYRTEGNLCVVWRKQTSVLSVVLKYEILKGLNKPDSKNRFLYQPTTKPAPRVSRVD